MLQHLTRNVQRQVGRIDKALHKAEVFGQKLLALLHDHHAVGVELQAALEVLRAEIERRLLGNEQQRRVGKHALGADVQHAHRLVEIIEVVAVERVVLFLCDLVFVLVPQRDAAVQRLVLIHRFVFVLGDFLLLLPPDLHLDRIADVVAVFLDQRGQTVFLQELVVIHLVRVRLEVQHDLRADGRILARRDRVAVLARGFPNRRLLAFLVRIDRHLVRHHERGIEPDAELPDHVDVLGVLQLLRKRARAALCNRAEVAFQLLRRHAAAVVRHGQRALRLVRL